MTRRLVLLMALAMSSTACDGTLLSGRDGAGSLDQGADSRLVTDDDSAVATDRGAGADDAVPVDSGVPADAVPVDSGVSADAVPVDSGVPADVGNKKDLATPADGDAAADMGGSHDLGSPSTGVVATHCDPTKPLCGIMYGVAISGESYGHTTKFKHSAAIKFQAEKTGTILSYTHHNRVYRLSEWDRDDNGDGFNEKFKCANSDPECKMKVMKNGGYNMGNGGLLSFSIHEDNGKGEPSAAALAQGTKTLVPTANKHYVGTYLGMKYYVGDNSYDPIPWDKPVPLTLGKYYYIVIRQLEPNKGSVVLNGFWVHHPGTDPESAPGGPYYGRRFAVFYKQSASDKWSTRVNVFPDFKLHYADGTVAGPGNDGVGGEYPRYKVQGNQMVRQVFTMDYDAKMSGLWVRLNRLSGSSPLTITVKNDTGGELANVSCPSTKIPDTYPDPVQGPVKWVYNAFSSPVSLSKGNKYYVAFKTSANTAYQLQTEETYDYQGGKKLSKESVWKGPDDRAEYSTTGEGGFQAVPRSVKDFSILFTVSGKPTVVN